jgi:hypothetical protein
LMEWGGGMQREGERGGGMEEDDDAWGGRRWSGGAGRRHLHLEVLELFGAEIYHGSLHGHGSTKEMRGSVWCW